MLWMNNWHTNLLLRREIESRCAPILMAPWELRVGNLRVYYDIEEEPEAVVFVRAVGVKQRNRVLIGGEVIE